MLFCGRAGTRLIAYNLWRRILTPSISLETRPTRCGLPSFPLWGMYGDIGLFLLDFLVSSVCHQSIGSMHPNWNATLEVMQIFFPRIAHALLPKSSIPAHDFLMRFNCMRERSLQPLDVQGGNDHEIFESPKTHGHTVTSVMDTLAQCKQIFIDPAAI